MMFNFVMFGIVVGSGVYLPVCDPAAHAGRNGAW